MIGAVLLVFDEHRAARTQYPLGLHTSPDSYLCSWYCCRLKVYVVSRSGTDWDFELVEDFEGFGFVVRP